MKRLLAFLFLLAVTSAAVGSDETLRRGIFGTYSRLLGMEATLVELREDGVYIVTVQGCLASEDEGRGRWTVRDGILLLDRSHDRKEKRDSFSRFDVVVLEGDIALKPQDDVFEPDGRNSESMLFRRQKKEANQTPQRNAGSRPSSGDSSASETPSSLGPRG